MDGNLNRRKNTVAKGAISAMQSSAGRREVTSLQLSPGLLVS